MIGQLRVAKRDPLLVGTHLGTFIKIYLHIPHGGHLSSGL